jgi:hypothetical protein
MSWARRTCFQLVPALNNGECRTSFQLVCSTKRLLIDETSWKLVLPITSETSWKLVLLTDHA